MAGDDRDGMLPEHFSIPETSPQLLPILLPLDSKLTRITEGKFTVVLDSSQIPAPEKGIVAFLEDMEKMRGLALRASLMLGTQREGRPGSEGDDHSWGESCERPHHLCSLRRDGDTEGMGPAPGVTRGFLSQRGWF